MGRLKYDAVVISDVHLGSRQCRAAQLADFLGKIDTPWLFIAGDLFDTPEIGPLDAAARMVLTRLYGALHHTERTQICWIKGNHDPDNFFLLGFRHHSSHLDVGGKDYLVTHGDMWDESMVMPRQMLYAIQVGYRLLQWIPGTGKLTRWLANQSESVGGFQEKVKNEAARFINGYNGVKWSDPIAKKASGIILGHTHVPFDGIVDGVHVVNAGSWVKDPCSYVGIKDGFAKLEYWEPQ